MKKYLLMLLVIIGVIAGCGKQEISFTELEEVPGEFEEQFQRVNVRGKGVFSKDEQHYAFVVVPSNHSVNFESIYYSPRNDHGMVYEFEVVEESDGNTNPDMNIEIIKYELSDEMEAELESHDFEGGGY